MSTLDTEYEHMLAGAQAVLDASETPRVTVPTFIPVTKDAS